MLNRISVVCILLLVALSATAVLATSGKLAYVQSGELSVIMIRDLKTGKDVQSDSLEDLYPDNGSLRWSPDGQKLVFSAYGKGKDGTKTTQIFSLNGVKPTFPNWSKRGYAPNLLPSGKLLSYGEGGIVFTGNDIHFKYLDPMTQLAAFPGGKKFAGYLNNDKGTYPRIGIFDLEKNKVLQVFKQGSSEMVSSLDVSPDGKRLAFTCGFAEVGNKLCVIDLATGKQKTLLQKVGNCATWASATTIYYLPYRSGDGLNQSKMPLMSCDMAGKTTKVATLNTTWTDNLAFHP